MSSNLVKFLAPLRSRSSRYHHKEDFVYKPLDTAHHSIRLLLVRVKPGGNVSYHLRQGLELGGHLCPNFIALSYTWGPPNPIQGIEVDGRIITVRQNLYDFLRVFRPGNGVPGISQAEEIRYLWIDQICIDQKSPVEKNHQVSMMADIYKTATKVRIWLGPGDAGSDLAMRFFHVLNELRHGFMQNRVDLSDFLDRPPGKDDVALELASGLRSYSLHQLITKGVYSPKPVLVSAFEELLARQYWKRLWILQEVILAGSITVSCGEYSIPWHWLLGANTADDWHPLHTAGHGKHVITMLLRFQGFTWYDFYSVATKFCDNECQDPRDKVYGLRGLLTIPYHILVDYTKSIEEVYIDGVLLILSEWTRKQDREDKLDYWEACEVLGHAMKPGAEAQVLERLQKDMKTLSWGMKDREALKSWYLDLLKAGGGNLDKST